MRRRSNHKIVKQAFTLLEVMLAVAILSIVSLALYRFLGNALGVVQIETTNASIDASCLGLKYFLRAQLNQLPVEKDNAFQGRHVKKVGGDELELLAQTGNGILSNKSRGGMYQVTWKLNPKPTLPITVSPGTPVGGELGVSISPLHSKKSQTSTSTTDHWVPLIEGISNFKIDYFSSSLNDWVSKWDDPNELPQLVRFNLSFISGHLPFEFILPLPPKPQKSDASILDDEGE